MGAIHRSSGEDALRRIPQSGVERDRHQSPHGDAVRRLGTEKKPQRTVLGQEERQSAACPPGSVKRWNARCRGSGVGSGNDPRRVLGGGPPLPLATGDFRRLAKFKNKTIKDDNGNIVPLLTDRTELKRLGSGGFSFESIYSPTT